jgi:SAM-dependent methyltransferase
VTARETGDHGAMVTSDLLAFVRSSLPEPPARVLEIGAGKGELASELREAGYEVTAIDPAAEPDTGVEPISLLDARGRFAAAVSVVSLHHIDPLAESCAHLAQLIAPGGPLVIDEIDVDRYDERATGWWLAQRGTLGALDHDTDAGKMIADLREHIHPLATVCASLEPYFELGPPVRGPYLHRWELLESLLATEVELIAGGHLPAVGARLVAVRRV